MTDINPSSSLLAPPAGELDSRRALDDDRFYGLSLETVVKVAILTPLFIAVYWLVLRWLWDKTNPINGEANWGHAVCIPFVGLYYLFFNREELLAQPVRPLLLGRLLDKWRLIPALGMIIVGGGILAMIAAKPSIDPDGLVKFAAQGLTAFGVLVLACDWGIGSMVMGLIAFAYGIWPGQNQFLQGMAMILTLFGIVLMLCGWRIMQFAMFPILYLVCAIPWPPLVYSYIASPLQTFAAKVAVVTLRFTGVNAYRTGTKINMGGITEPLRTLNVAEACAGLRSLMTFITVGIAVAFLSARPLWQKIIISLSSIPIAIFCNVMRIAGQGLLDHYISRELSESFAHQFVGLVMLVPAFFMILLVGWVMDQIFIEEVESKEERAAAARAAKEAEALVVEIPRKVLVQPVARTPKGGGASSKPQAASAARGGLAPSRPTPVRRPPPQQPPTAMEGQ